MPSKIASEPVQRLHLLRRLLEAGEIGTQEELVEELRRQKYTVTQSTISRDLRRLGAIKTVDQDGQTVYRLPDDPGIGAAMPPTSGLRNLLLNIQHNGALIVIHTTPGSASLVARQLDQTRPEGMLGTLAGDDTIFVAPASQRMIEKTIQAIVAQFA